MPLMLQINKWILHTVQVDWYLPRNSVLWIPGGTSSTASHQKKKKKLLCVATYEWHANYVYNNKSIISCYKFSSLQDLLEGRERTLGVWDHICVLLYIASYMYICANLTLITFIAMLVCKYFYIKITNNFCIFHNLKDAGTHNKEFQGHL